ncbi:hypothetical protein EDD15DRAFT_2198946 [Pisolithus albus]|nr:hypothetical protein EDD15DRAFT_2198946 [Pisolithus albus]
MARLLGNYGAFRLWLKLVDSQSCSNTSLFVVLGPASSLEPSQAELWGWPVGAQGPAWSFEKLRATASGRGLVAVLWTHSEGHVVHSQCVQLLGLLMGWVPENYFLSVASIPHCLSKSLANSQPCTTHRELPIGVSCVTSGYTIQEISAFWCMEHHYLSY